MIFIASDFVNAMEWNYVIFMIAIVLCCNSKKTWIEHQGVWYFRSQNKFNFTDAIAFCNEGANIAIVTSMEQNNFLKKNNFTGWIGLTNTQIMNFRTPLTVNETYRTEPSYLDEWIWTVHSWDIQIVINQLGNTSGLSPLKFGEYSTLNQTDALKASNSSAAVLSHTKFWGIEPTTNLNFAICEWQCRKVYIKANDSRIQNNEYNMKEYINTRRYYESKNKDMYLYYQISSSPSDHWIIYNMLSPSGYIIFIHNEQQSPFYNKTPWTRKINDPPMQDIFVEFKCITGSEEYNTTEYNCSGFEVYQLNNSSQYLFLNDVHGSKYWCKGNAPCTDNITVCNTHTTPFLDQLNGNWVHPDELKPTFFTTVSVTTPEIISTSGIMSNSTEDSKSNGNFILHIGIGCAIGFMSIVVIVVLVIVICRRKRSQSTKSKDLKTLDSTKPEFKDYSYVCARDVIQQDGVNNNIAMRKLTQLDTENENSHMYSLEKIPQVNTTPVNDDISKQNEYCTNINQNCDTYEDIETIHDQNLTDSDKAKAQRLVDTSPKPVKPPRTFAHESVHSDEESPPPPVPSKGVLDSGKKTVFDNIVFDKDEEHDIELFENTIYETNVTK